MRNHAPLLTKIWDDEDFCSLPAMAQRIYFQIMSQKRLTMVGVLPYLPRNWSRGASDLTVEDVEFQVGVLELRGYVIVDRNTEELLARTIVKHDPPRGSKSIAGMWNAWREVDSKTIKAAILAELSTDIWDHPHAEPPPEAKALRNGASDGASDAENRAENGGVQKTDSISHLPPSTDHPPPSNRHSTCSTGDDDTPAKKKTNDVIDYLVGHRIEQAGKQVGPAYRVKVQRDVATTKGATIARLVQMFPDAPIDSIAHGAETGDTRNLAHYAQPTEEQP